MAARRRQRNRQDWPKYLYETNGYYYWRHPVTDESFGLGRDFEKAQTQALEANLHLQQQREKARLVDRITGNDKRTVGNLLVRYVKDMAGKNLAENTLRTKKSMISRIEDRWGTHPYSTLTTAMVDEFLQELITDGKERMAQSFRSFMIDVGNKAIAIGWATHNPAAVTEAVKVTVKRARLTLDSFMAIYDKAAELDPYAQRAMELAMVTAQRREDIALWERSDIRDGGLWVEQGKSENTEMRGAGVQTRLVIPLDLRMSIATPSGRVIDWTLKDVIARCRADHVASRYLIHHSKPRTKSKPGDPVWKDTVSKSFAKARDLTELEWEGKAPPTFHEIRSLAIRVWKELRGKDFAQALAGHKQASTTDVYADERGNWVVLKTA